MYLKGSVVPSNQDLMYGWVTQEETVILEIMSLLSLAQPVQTFGTLVLMMSSKNFRGLSYEVMKIAL